MLEKWRRVAGQHKADLPARLRPLHQTIFETPVCKELRGGYFGGEAELSASLLSFGGGDFQPARSSSAIP